MASEAQKSCAHHVLVFKDMCRIVECEDCARQWKSDLGAIPEMQLPVDRKRSSKWGRWSVK